MEIVIIGTEFQLREAQSKFGGVHHYFRASDHGKAISLLKNADVVFDFLIASAPSEIEIYNPFTNLITFLDTSLISLSSLNSKDVSKMLIGFCGMPTFLNRELLEVSLLNKDQEPELKRICNELNTSYQIVADKTGLVTPRVICMIINEAYYTVEEGTASKEDIDKAMKLGTNYPYGPFEWCEKIGKKNVADFLESIHHSSGNHRYKVSDLLKRESLT